ncbi:TPA: hypothetical protein ACOF1R_003008 [Staphylococcus aureus]
MRTLSHWDFYALLGF